MDEQIAERINIEELFETKQNTELKRKSVYLRILQRVHKKIKTTSRQRDSNNYCFFIIPEIIIGIPKYNLELCKEFLFKNLIDNGFKIKYTHPNLLFISWNHILPSYMRREIKKNTGLTVDKFGKIVKKKTPLELESAPGPEKKKNPENTGVKSINSGIYNFDFLKDIDL